MDKTERNIAGAAGALALTAAGYLAGAIINPKPPKVYVPQPICGCGHHFSLHGDGACSWTNNKKVIVERGKPRTLTDEYGTSKTIYGHEVFDYVEETCPCKTYAGPQHRPDPTLPGA